MTQSVHSLLRRPAVLGDSCAMRACPWLQALLKTLLLCWFLGWVQGEWVSWGKNLAQFSPVLFTCWVLSSTSVPQGVTVPWERLLLYLGSKGSGMLRGRAHFRSFLKMAVLFHWYIPCLFVFFLTAFFFPPSLVDLWHLEESFYGTEVKTRWCWARMLVYFIWSQNCVAFEHGKEWPIAIIICRKEGNNFYRIFQIHRKPRTVMSTSL